MDSALYKISNWIMRLAYVNLVWLMMVLAGLIFFGFFPATVAMFAVVRQWIKGNTDAPVFSTMWQNYKQEFIRANIIGVLVVFAGFVLYIDYLFFFGMEGILGTLMMFAFFTLFLFYLMVLAFIFPVLAHFDVRSLESVKYAFICGASYPFHTFYIILSIGIVLYGLTFVPVLFIFFGGSVLSLIVMRFAYTAFEKAEKKRAGN